MVINILYKSQCFHQLMTSNDNLQTLHLPNYRKVHMNQQNLKTRHFHILIELYILVNHTVHLIFPMLIYKHLFHSHSVNYWAKTYKNLLLQGLNPYEIKLGHTYFLFLINVNMPQPQTLKPYHEYLKIFNFQVCEIFNPIKFFLSNFHPKMNN